MHRPLVTALLGFVAALINTPSNDAEQIAQKKEDVSKKLKEMDVSDDPALVDEVKGLVNLAAAANPPSKTDVENAARIGELKT